MKTTTTILALACLTTLGAQAATWEDYCSADGKATADSFALPSPNYKNKIVKAAATKLSAVEKSEKAGRKEDDKEPGSVAFNPYTEFEKVYGLCAGRGKFKGRCKDEQLPTDKKVGVLAHNTLTILCGEFRDNFKLLEAKLKWFGRISITKDVDQKYNPKKKVFAQMTGPGYEKFKQISEDLYTARQDELGQEGDSFLEVDQKSVSPVSICEHRYIMSEYLATDKDFFGDSHLDEYNDGLKKWLADKKNCTKTDKDHYYEFRGDGNLKAQSLESNGTIWISRAYAKSCTPDKKVARAAYGTATGKWDCEGYFKSPWETRTRINKEMAARLFFYPEHHNGHSLGDLFADYAQGSQPQTLLLITEDVSGDGVGEMLYLNEEALEDCFQIDEYSDVDELRKIQNDKDVSGACVYAAKRVEINNALNNAQESGEMSFNQVWPRKQAINKEIYHLMLLSNKDFFSKNKKFKMALQAAEKANKDKYEWSEKNLTGIEFVTEVTEGWSGKDLKAKDWGFTKAFKTKASAWERLTRVPDRHTDWYTTDMLNFKTGTYMPVYSPWLASSYYIYNSHDFVMPGYAQGNEYDSGRMHWMFVQKVKKSKWFNASRMNKKWPVSARTFDMENFWFDEMTFSRSDLGTSENGWDRFEAAAPSEIESIFWLYEVPQIH